MARARAWLENGSILKAIDGSHLKWNDFREDVLQPFGIRVTNSNELNSVPQALLVRLQERLVNLGRFDSQREKWQSQVSLGQGFNSPTIFPPNILPQVWSLTKIERFLSPKMSREVLPRREKSAKGLFELPSAKPIYAAAFVADVFSETEHLSLPSSFSPSGTVVDFATGIIDSGRILHCPFLVFERCHSMESDDIENALNMCAVSGAQCIRGLQDISQRAYKKFSEEIYSFSCAINDKMATINIHTVDKQGKYVMSALYKFDLMINEHFNTFQAWIEAIEDWASSALLPQLKDCLTKITHSGDTPPASPMPSLTLSIDTDVGSIPGLIQALRRTYPTIAWQSDEAIDSPINSSIAHCGTPAEGRRTQALGLVSPGPNTFGNLMLRRGRGQSLISPINTRNPQFPYTPARPSPFSPRYMANPPATACDPALESPCRPGSLSPYTPPPDQPWAAKSPMLVLQKRVDVAMNEVQDLRHQVEMLQSELAVRNQQLSERLSAMEMLQKLQKKQSEDKLRAKQMEQERQRQQHEQAKVEVIEEETELKPTWMSFVHKYEGWDILLEQMLFLLVLFALVGMGVMVFRDLLPMLLQIPLVLSAKVSAFSSYLLVLLDYRRILGIRELLPNLNLVRYISIWQSWE